MSTQLGQPFGGIVGPNTLIGDRNYPYGGLGNREVGYPETGQAGRDYPEFDAENPARIGVVGQVSRTFTGAGSQIETGRYPDSGATYPLAGPVSDLRSQSPVPWPIQYVKAGSPDFYVHSEAEREKAIADGYVPAFPESPAPHVRMETVQYADGSSATGVAPLPRVSPTGSPAI
jgi:hypothetical protein